MGKEVSVAGWGKTNEGYTQNKKNQLVSKTNIVMHSIFKYSLEDISIEVHQDSKRRGSRVVQNQMSKECVDMMCESLLLIQSRAVLTFYNIITNILIYNYFHNRMLAHHQMFFCTLTFLSLLIVMKPSRV